MNKINLNRIINNHIDTSKMNKYDIQAIVNGFIMFGEQLLELAAKNAKIKEKKRTVKCSSGYEWVYDKIINKKSIINTIKQVE